MENQYEFPLLRLPCLAIQDVLGSMSPLEQISFSMTSLRCKKLTQLFSKVANQYEVSMFIGNEPRFDMRTFEDMYEYRMTSKQNMHMFRQWDMEEGETVFLYSEDILEDFLKWFCYVKEVFRIRIDILYYGMDKFQNRNVYIIDWLKMQTSEYYILEAYGNNVRHEDVQYLLDNVTVLGELNLEVEMDNSQSLHVPKWPLNLIIWKGEWIGLQQLLSFSSPLIDLSYTSLSEKDLNQFLKSWMLSKTHQGLKHSKVHIRNRQTFFQIIDGLKLEYPDEGVLERRDLLTIAEQEGVCIQNRSGKMATIHTHFPCGNWLLNMVVEDYNF